MYPHRLPYPDGAEQRAETAPANYDHKPNVGLTPSRGRPDSPISPKASCSENDLCNTVVLDKQQDRLSVILTVINSQNPPDACKVSDSVYQLTSLCPQHDDPPGCVASLIPCESIPDMVGCGRDPITHSH